MLIHDSTIPPITHNTKKAIINISFPKVNNFAPLPLLLSLFILVMRSTLHDFHAVFVYLEHYPVFFVNAYTPISCKVSA